VIISTYSNQSKPLANHKGTVFVTGNRMKLQEVRYILSSNADVELTSQNLDGWFTAHGCIIDEKIDFLSVPEIQGTTEEVAKEKCRRAAELLQGPCITEDTALCFEALNGLPGPYIKHFMTSLGLDGLNIRTPLRGFPDLTVNQALTPF
jgi:inosine triphosphate pyrophosphatase